jgi:hypothetical protein
MIIRNEKLDRYEFLYDQNGKLISSALLWKARFAFL